MDQSTKEIYPSNIHLENTSEYLTVDLAAQNDSRDCFTNGSITELPKVIFDKKQIITFQDENKIDWEKLNTIFKEKKNRILQYSE